jgi:CheY-like chemotaxis protein
MARVLIIDDDAQTRNVMRLMLERAGYEVLETPNGRDGVHQYQATAIDVLLLDMRLPGPGWDRDLPHAAAAGPGAWPVPSPPTRSRLPSHAMSPPLR